MSELPLLASLGESRSAYHSTAVDRLSDLRRQLQAFGGASTIATNAFPSNAETDVRTSDVCSQPSSDRPNPTWRDRSRMGAPTSDLRISGASHGFGRGIGQGHGHELSSLPPANAATARRRSSGSLDLSATSSTACDTFPISPSALNSAWRTCDDVSVWKAFTIAFAVDGSAISPSAHAAITRMRWCCR